ncbi:uncharacterized protein BDV17DRAFT_258916 [Aspergillus undulatus]|uniref:uncharacterized protein n=1 Tax=Aspergillus undulatus TaxID=1810928 RepID=UPI003CCD99F1
MRCGCDLSSESRSRHEVITRRSSLHSESAVMLGCCSMAAVCRLCELVAAGLGDPLVIGERAWRDYGEMRTIADLRLRVSRNWLLGWSRILLHSSLNCLAKKAV